MYVIEEKTQNRARRQTRISAAERTESAPRACSLTMIELRTTNARGVLCGKSQPMCKWSDSMVAQAREMYAVGWTIRAIAAQLDGPHQWTVWRWVSNTDRKPQARIVARRVKPKTPAALDTDEETPTQNMSHQPEALTSSASSPSSTLLDSTLDSSNRKNDQKGHPTMTYGLSPSATVKALQRTANPTTTFVLSIEKIYRRTISLPLNASCVHGGAA
jgi:hypothetical protein